MIYKNSMTKIFCIFLIFLFLFSSFSVYGDDFNEEDENTNILIKEASSSDAISSSLDLNSRSCITIDRLTHTILYGKNEKNKVKMASTTKIMTAIIVLENTSLDKTVEVSKKAASTGGSRLGLKVGDKITIHDLLYGLLLRSGNDAAVCLAESVAGNISDFANLMNAKATSLGLSNTHFESPHGLDSPNHYTTAYELALLTDYALKNQTFLAIVGTKNYTITINGSPKTLTNTNELLGNLEGVYGVKTGFTNGANRCLVTACKRGNMDIICVVLGADTKNFRTKDSIKLIEYTFKTYEYFPVKDSVSQSLAQWKTEHPDYFIVEKGISSQLDIKVDSCLEDTPMLPVKKDFIPGIETTISIQSYLLAPVLPNDYLGHITLSSQGNFLAAYNLLSDTTIPKNKVTDYMLHFFKSYPYQLENSLF